LSAEGTPPSAEAGRIFLAEANRLRPIDPTNGRAPWSADLGGEPTWVGYLADRILAATPTRLMALSLDQGAIEWRYPADDPGSGQAVSNPFAKGDEDPGRDPAAAAPLHGFRIVGNRVFCLRGDRELIALDGDTGLVEWTFAPALGRLNPHFWVGPRRVVLQIVGSNATAVAVLEVARGLGHEYPQDDGASPWTRDPLPLDDDHAVLSLNGHSVGLLDLDRGQLDWTCPHPTVLPSSGAPLPLGDAGRLLVLFGGTELVRLDPATGKELWVRTLGPDDLADRPRALALGADRVYGVQGDPDHLGGATLTAFALADGAPVWNRHLIGPASGWVLSLTDRYVVAHPSPGPGIDRALSGLPLVFCRRDTGALVQRVVFPADISALAVRLAPQGTLIASQAGLWALGGLPTVDGVKGPR
jgi:outer membrane protein assembly factor BamB